MICEWWPVVGLICRDFHPVLGGWEMYGWRKFYYDSEEAVDEEVDVPAIDSNSTNEVGIVPEHHLFDFRHPSLTQKFKIVPNSTLMVEFLLLVRGSKSSGNLFSFFFKLDPGFDVYFGNLKVFSFKQHGINDEVMHIGLNLHFSVKSLL